jgi:hypothetical protein
MSNEPIEIETIGDQAIKQFFVVAPTLLTRAMNVIFRREARKFVGDKKKNGKFREELMAKNRKYLPGKWKPFVARAFTGGVVDKDKLGSMRLVIGILKQRRIKLPYLESLGKDNPIRASKSWLIIPNYSVLRSVGLYGKRGSRGKSTFAKLFGQLYDAKQLTTIFFKGKMFAFGNFPSYTPGDKRERHQNRLHRKLLFTGVKSVQIPKQFDFFKSWNTHFAGFETRATKFIQKVIDREATKLDKKANYNLGSAVLDIAQGEING